eukprot:TRINITY_DN23720_c0_g1_i1.p1 TRINITY_DN23720_c0_g1~~TRINITY_DN23720_c0_g1_i1.p1  ORF type:complete len:922 (-),score=76.94 TRINITY_DN23720_c0_g1_i1:19-2784(-)
MWQLSAWMPRWCCKQLWFPAAAVVATVGGSGTGTSDASARPSRSQVPQGYDEFSLGLDLDSFVDVDCMEVSNAKVLLELMLELCEVLEAAYLGADASNAWAEFRKWRSQWGPILFQLAGSVFSRPYCEPGKVAGAAATCLLLYDEPGAPFQAEHTLECIRDVEDMLQATAPKGEPIYATRLHMFLRSPWPAFRLLDALVRLWPDKNSSLAAYDMGRCHANRDWLGAPLEFDWQWFQQSLNTALMATSKDPYLFELRPDDGPLSEQYRQRHARIYKKAAFREVAAFGSACFFKFRRQQWEAGCHPGVVASYLLQVITFSIRDTEAWLQRYVGAAWRLLNLLTPLTSLLNSNWPIFRTLHVGSQLRRNLWRLPAESTVQPTPKAHPFHRELADRVSRALESDTGKAVYVSSAWGLFSSPDVLGVFLSRWHSLTFPKLILLAFDEAAKQTCETHASGSQVTCIHVEQRPGADVFVVKYLTLAFIARRGKMAIWLDLDVYLPVDPTSSFEATLAGAGFPPFAFGGFLTSRSLCPSIVVARAGKEAAQFLIEYASWLHEHPYILDHLGWDAFTQNPDGDSSGAWDYKGRNISAGAGDGLELSFVPPPSLRKRWVRRSPPRYVRLNSSFASADGFVDAIDDLRSFHFWGTERPLELFKHFYPFDKLGFGMQAKRMLLKYLRVPMSLDSASVHARAQVRAHITAVTYADGCCAQSIERNRRSALENGADVALALGRADLDPAWIGRHNAILSQRKGAGWWLWKPKVILQALRNDELVPWYRGVVLWLDAGNFYIGDPQPVVSRALRDSDVAAMRLKCCSESDWTSDQALRLLDGKGYAIAERPQLGAYFLMFRKTPVALDFVEEWLRMSENPDIIMESGGASNMDASAGYQRHMADQSVFSVLFKQRGFQAMALVEGHRVVQLDRWRE